MDPVARNYVGLGVKHPLFQPEIPAVERQSNHILGFDLWLCGPSQLPTSLGGLNIYPLTASGMFPSQTLGVVVDSISCDLLFVSSVPFCRA